MSNIWLNEIQRQQTANRIRSDNELLDRGAQITATGRLALIGSQLEHVTLIASGCTDFARPMMDESSPEPHPMDTWLDTNLSKAWAQTIGEKGGAYKRFVAAGFHSLRDLVTTGKVWTSDMRGAGIKQIGKLEQIIAANPHGLTWDDIPTPERIAGICTRLSQVHAGALDLGLPLERMSVMDVLKTPLKERPHFFSRNNFIHPTVYAETGNVPEIFALKFEQARMEIQYARHSDA